MQAGRHAGMRARRHSGRPRFTVLCSVASCRVTLCCIASDACGVSYRIACLVAHRVCSWVFRDVMFEDMGFEHHS